MRIPTPITDRSRRFRREKWNWKYLLSSTYNLFSLGILYSLNKKYKYSIIITNDFALYQFNSCTDKKHFVKYCHVPRSTFVHTRLIYHRFKCRSGYQDVANLEKLSLGSTRIFLACGELENNHFIRWKWWKPCDIFTNIIISEIVFHRALTATLSTVHCVHLVKTLLVPLSPCTHTNY